MRSFHSLLYYYTALLLLHGKLLHPLPPPSSCCCLSSRSNMPVCQGRAGRAQLGAGRATEQSMAGDWEAKGRQHASWRGLGQCLRRQSQVSRLPLLPLFPVPGSSIRMIAYGCLLGRKQGFCLAQHHGLLCGPPQVHPVRPGCGAVWQSVKESRSLRSPLYRPLAHAVLPLSSSPILDPCGFPLVVCLSSGACWCARWRAREAAWV